MKPEIRRYLNLSDLSKAAAEFICELAETTVSGRSTLSLALSGGKTPRLLYENLAKEPFAGRMPWEQTHLFWGDERCVPPENAQSNFALASRTMISKVPIPQGNIHRIPAEAEPPSGGAAAYERILRDFFLPSLVEEPPPAFPTFDLVLLGLGEDGHTASLFPGEAGLEERTRWVVAVSGAKASPPIPRVTLTLPLINQAGCVLFLASGIEKMKVVQAILDNPEKAVQLYPAARVRPSGRLLWFINEGSA